MCGICSSKGNPQLDRFTHLFPGSAAGRQPLNQFCKHLISQHIFLKDDFELVKTYLATYRRDITTTGPGEHSKQVKCKADQPS